MILYRGVNKNEYEYYKEHGIPKNNNFTNKLMGAKNKGNFIIVIEKNKSFIPDNKNNRVFKKLKISERYYQNIKPIRKFKLK